jgi:oligopeptide/dipeptide ABC transporter ATP-binding protein
MSGSEELLNIHRLSTHFFTENGVVQAVEAVDLKIGRGEIVGLVGESGCGKTVTTLSIMRLLPSPGRIVNGEIWFEKENLIEKSEPEMRKIRGNRISMIFQEPMSSLNPVLTIGEQIAEVIKSHQGLSRAQAKNMAVEMLDLVGVPAAATRVNEYPHQLSGGMRQRVMIAMALACKPALLIADEPTTALDVTIQAQVLDLMRDLQKKFHTAIMLITHDLGVVAEMCDEVVVMYLGRVVEHAKVRPIFHDPKHPYTQGLLRSIPSLASRKQRLEPIKGVVPDPLNAPPGCPFHPRCPHEMEICRREMPPLKEVAPDHQAACWLY